MILQQEQAAQQCDACSFPSPAGMSFCGRCGAPLRPAPPPARVAWREAEAGDAPHTQERRRLTVLFSDLVESTELSERLDPEEFGHLLRGYKEACARAVLRHQGFISAYIGDGVLAYFGYPRAMEGAPIEAVYAGLAILAEIASLNAREEGRPGLPLAVRIGIATGVVVAGDQLGGTVVERAAAHGLTPNLASRLQTAANPNTLLISEETYQQVHGRFEVRDLGALALKGVTRPERVFQVVRERTNLPRFRASTGFGGTDMVGRDRELAALRDAWRLAERGNGSVVLVRGEPGVGKSRLVHEFSHSLDAKSHAKVFLDCSQHHRHTAFHPIANELRRRLRIVAATDHATALSRLEAFVDEAGLSRIEAVPLLAGLLLVDSGTRHPPLALTPRRRRERLLEVLATLLQRLLVSRPTLVVVEDFHWADPSTAEAVLYLLQHTIRGRVLWLITHRSEHAFPELERLMGSALDLERLDQSCSLRVARAVAGTDRISDAIIRAIAERADGVPIFLEQLTKSVAEGLHRGRDPATPLAVPSSLQDSLVARLDRLREGKRVAQIAAVIGRRFATSLLERIAPMPKAHLAEGLNELLTAGLICPDPAGGEGHYLFRHTLMRDAAYETLLISTRRQLHHDVAQAITRWFPALATTEPELLGQHLTLADRPAEAIDAWTAAGQAAFRRLNLAEAVAHFRQGLALLPRLAEGDHRNERELALQAGLGAALILTSGYGAPEVETAYGRAFSLCERSGADSIQLFQIIWGIWSHKIIRGQHGLGTSAADRLMLIAERRRDPELRMLAHSAQVLTRCVLGDFLGAEHHAAAALSLHDPERDRLHALTYSVDPKAMVLMFLQHVLWIRGRAEEAEAVGTQCLARAEQLGNPFVTPYVLVWGGVPLLYAGRHDALVKRMDTGIARAREACLPFWVVSGGVWRAAGLIGRGEVAEGAALLEDSLAHLAGAGVRFTLPYRQALLALARCRLGRTAEGAMLAREAFELATSSGEGMHAAEIRRIQGDVLLAQKAPDRAGAERCYLDAIDLARRQASHGWELRAAVSLARLWREDGRGARGLDFVAAATGQLGSHHAPEVEEALELLGA